MLLIGKHCEVIFANYGTFNLLWHWIRCCLVLFQLSSNDQNISDDVTYHILECFPGSLQVIQVGSAGLNSWIVQLLEGRSA